MKTFVDVAVPVPVHRAFTYAVPETLQGQVQAGSRLLVPFGSRHLVGVALRLLEETSQEDLREVRQVLDREPLLPASLLELGLWVSSYYLAPPGEALRVLFPPGLLRRSASPEADPGRYWPVRRRQAVVGLHDSAEKLTPRQREVLEELHRRTLPVPVQQLLEETGSSLYLLKALERKGWLTLQEIDLPRSPFAAGEAEPVHPHPLTAAQQEILQRIRALQERSGFDTLLIHGVTGSGKTEIYLNAIATALQEDKSGLLLVPEIGLTPQICRQFRGWFGSRVAILHSGLSEGERFDQWRRIRRGEARVVVGTRSAVFAPVQNLGVLIVDEEHDTSYKQEETPRYHARDVALKRGQIEGALVLLGSATPQLETYYQSTRQKRKIQRLTTRILERPLPVVEVVDMREEFERHGRGVLFSSLLQEKMAHRLARDEQILVLLNRRGYSPVVLCRSCGHTETCRNCSISLTFHQGWNRQVCHYCGYSRSVPPRCPECSKEFIYFLGEGTEKVEEELRRLFPHTPVGRLDRDTTRRRGSLEGILQAFASGRTRILVGTQMVAKGHDFPNVTLVGVLGADQGLRLADFRAAERTFQLLTQVAGRAGRGDRPGEVVIQTYFPHHYSLKYACAQDYERFYRQEIQFRRRFRYPPFSALANLVVKGPTAERARQLAQRLVQRLQQHRRELARPEELKVLGPAPAPIERLKGEHRFQVLLKANHRPRMREVIRRALEDLRREKAPLKRIAVDIDPVSLL